MGPNLGGTKLGFLYCQFYFWHEGERLDETLAEWAANGGL